MAAAMATLAGSKERIVVVPPEVRSSFWVEDQNVSRSYFLEWGYYVLSLLLNVTPDSIGYQSEVLLRYVAPESKDQMRSRLAAAATKLHDESLSTFFAVSAVETRPEMGQVAFSGTLASYVKGRKISERAAAFAATFAVNRGQLALVELIETDPTDMFALLDK